MTNDVVFLRNFYASSLGQIAKKDIKNSIQKIWPSCKNQVILGAGYTLPFLSHFDFTNNTIYSFMPSQQGVSGWPSCHPTMSALISEESLPLPDQSIDRILCIHMLENCHDPHAFLKEAWRILKPEGRMLFVVPNRRGLWAHVNNNPFGQGKPYTMTQLTTLLQAHLFTPLFQHRGLYAPPTSFKSFSQMTPLLEKIGPKCLQKFSGVIHVESIKKIYAITGKPIFVKRLNLPPLSELVGRHAKACDQ